MDMASMQRIRPSTKLLSCMKHIIALGSDPNLQFTTNFMYGFHSAAMK